VVERLSALPPPQAPHSALLAGGMSYGDGEPSVQRPIWRALSGTDREIDSVHQLFRKSGIGVQVLRGDQATESALRRHAPQHQVLHLATHGFFDAPEYRQALLQATLRAPGAWEGLPDFLRDFAALEPSLLSGLVLSNANRPSSRDPADDGLLTALELGDLDLQSVSLVTVSACESGLGELHASEGCLGLPRALLSAGARSCITSLWQIEDEATARLMQEFYANWLEKNQRPLEALHNAQRSLLRQPLGNTAVVRRGLKQLSEDTSRPVGSPYFWAAFVFSGDWR
jgi:CHAT domain-containing protein